jgi:hypothetical protein
MMIRSATIAALALAGAFAVFALAARTERIRQVLTCGSFGPFGCLPSGQ